MSLDDANRYLAWPPPEAVTNPSGGAPRVYARQVEQKIGGSLKRRFGLSVTTGVLVPDPEADSAEAPLAIVCQFSNAVSDEALREAHRLAWNFSHTALLITLEPHRIQAWTCSRAPRKGRNLDDLRVVSPITNATSDADSKSLFQSEVAQVLHWVSLASGQFLRDHESRFHVTERADALLVSNLRAVRKKLLGHGLSREVCHSLLARLIFTQFLFQRTDSAGRPAISQNLLDGQLDGSLRGTYSHATALAEILADKGETYALFRWLNRKFNGDLFPGKGTSERQREREWQEEKAAVQQLHLDLLIEFVTGRLNVASGQRSLWPEYSFDTLPLEFISSVYEEFLNEDQKVASAYYTPPHLVDFLLDGVLPWGGKEWNLRILDPCCGSGIFLVKAFQRLVQRWRNANSGDEPDADTLRSLLLNNLLGVDRSGEAVRVASFSLCLALCDAIDPRHYWKRTLFPRLRGSRLLESDFFEEDKIGIRTVEDAASWDLVIGNAPWRGGALDDASPGVLWAQEHDWPIADKNPGPIFLVKAAALTKSLGRVSMIQPAATLLYQRAWKPTLEFRAKFFTTLCVEEVVSFAHLRWQLFGNAKSPACLVTFQPVLPSADHEILYVCPRPQFSATDDGAVIIEPHEINRLSVQEAAGNGYAWISLLLGSQRDLDLVQRLSSLMTLGRLKQAKIVLTREGIIRGSTKQRAETQILNRRILEAPNFPDEDSLWLKAADLPLNHDPKVDQKASSNFDAFALPQMLIKKSILREDGKFVAKLVRSDATNSGVICTHSYVSVHQPSGDEWLRAACLTFRSRVSAYFLALTSRLAFDRGEALSGDMLDVPIPDPANGWLPKTLSINGTDEIVEKAFGLSQAETALIEDLLDYGYREGVTDDSVRPARLATERTHENEKGTLHTYADYFLRAMQATFGSERSMSATIFEEKRGTSKVPVRMVAIHLDWPRRRKPIAYEIISASALRQRMLEFWQQQLGPRARQGAPSLKGGTSFQRVARIFITHHPAKGERIPTVLFLKPDQKRYWTRSQALRDADELAASIMTAGQRQKPKA
jgi:hypothetical protein